MVPFAYSYRNLLVRWRTTLVTAVCFTLVVTALIIMLAFLGGVESICTESGQAENVLCLQKGVTDEVLSRMDHQLVSQIEATAGVLRDGEQRMSSPELFMVIIQKQDIGDATMYQVRGVQPVAFQVHNRVRIVRGRMFRRHSRDVILGAAIARTLELGPGDELPIGNAVWDVAGVLEADGSAFESEIWADLDQIGSHFRRQGLITSLVLRTAGPDAAQRTVEKLRSSRRLSVAAFVEPRYYEQQAQPTRILRSGAVLIALVMAMGAVLGVMNTMFAAIANRITDIAVMRLLGFGRAHILVAFLLESLVIALIGGMLGILCGYALNGLTLSVAVGVKQVAFAFRVTTPMLETVAAFTLAMGILGGMLPAISAMTVKPLDAFR
jgi:putative ABC transport system permease protein